jgi:hypothetical protein
MREISDEVFKKMRRDCEEWAPEQMLDEIRGNIEGDGFATEIKLSAVELLRPELARVATFSAASGMRTILERMWAIGRIEDGRFLIRSYVEEIEKALAVTFDEPTTIEEVLLIEYGDDDLHALVEHCDTIIRDVEAIRKKFIEMAAVREAGH